MTYRHLTQLASVLRSAGLKVEEVPGWQTRGRPASTGNFDPVGVLCHHTATGRSTSDSAVIRLLVGGRSDLPGPLCHLGLGRDGTFYVVAAGRANHAGKAKASGTVGAGDGNELYIGIEAFNDGVGEKWAEAQYDAYVKGCAALSLEITGNSAATVRGHKETSVTGKIDPTFNMDRFRGWVTLEMKPKPVAKPKPKPGPKVTHLTVASHNVQHALPVTAVEGAINRLAGRGAGIIALQECGGIPRRLALKAVAAAKGYGIHHPFGTDKGAPCPILWDKTQFDLVATGNPQISPRGEYGLSAAEKGNRVAIAGPVEIPAQTANYVTLKHKASGRQVNVVNVHLAPSIHVRSRRKLWLDQAAAVLNLVDTLSGLVVVVGDMNNTPGSDLFNTWKAAGLVCANDPKVSTHEDGRAIDHAWYVAAPHRITGTKTAVLEAPGWPSDHSPVTVKFDVVAR